MRKTLIARATGSDGEPCVEIRVVYDRLPTYLNHRAHEDAVKRAFNDLFHERAVHISSATLPYSIEDDPEEEACPPTNPPM